MAQVPFLRSVVDYYRAEVACRPKIADVLFVVPNKRSALFLKRTVQQSFDKVSLMPRIMTLQTFTSIFSDYPVLDRRELLFLLYDAYRKVMARRGQADAVKQFDNFIFWGEMILDDFDEIDNSLVNADEIFKNLKGLKEIQADYLDADQKEVIRRVWGESRLTANIERFWLHISPKDSDEAPENKFVFLWEILADIYHAYRANLTERKGASAGSMIRQAAEKVKDFKRVDYTGRTAFAFVGFNDLTPAETLVFDRMKKLAGAAFFWDTAPLKLFAESPDNALPKPLVRLRTLIKNFPMPDDYELSLPECRPEVLVAAVPSNIGQAKCVEGTLREWLKMEYYDPKNPINTAIILPDQGLLLPVLSSIPAEIEALNISVSLPYRTTNFASLMHAIISMQLRMRKIHGRPYFFHEDVNAVLNHPHIQTIAPEAAAAAIEYISHERMYNIDAADFFAPHAGRKGDAEICSLAPLFRPQLEPDNARSVEQYLSDLFSWLGRQLTRAANIKDGREPDAPRYGDESFEIKALGHFKEKLGALSDLIERYGVSMSDRTFLQLFERIFAAIPMPLTGTPLRGLQILGVLETRNLDFDNVIVLSMNERLFPRKQYSKTMIPGTLRAGYGLSDFDTLEWTYAYSFYRIVARAKHVTLFYDSRTAGAGLGEKSRYITQLDLLLPGLDVTTRQVSTGESTARGKVVEVAKTEEVMRHLQRFREGGDLRLSATAIKSYINCPLQFYLQYVRAMRADDETVDNLTAAEYGTIVHNTIQELYANHSDGLITADVINGWLEGSTADIGAIALDNIDAIRYKAYRGRSLDEHPRECAIAVESIKTIVEANLRAERDCYCRPSFRHIANEFKADHTKYGAWEVAPGLKINFYMSVDRVDEIRPGLLRFVDFKTGSDELTIGDIESVFTSGHKKHGLLQLLIYSEAYLSIVDPDVDIFPVLHLLRDIVTAKPIEPLRINRKPLNSYREIRDTFRPILARSISEIFDPEVPFRPCDDEDKCLYCNFKALCGRNPIQH